jgi:hypothetical protein
LEEPPAWNSDQTCDQVGAVFASAVAADAGFGVHLAVELRYEEKCQASANRLNAIRPFPDVAPIVETIPDALRALANLVRAHAGVRRKHLGPPGGRDEPVTRYGNAIHQSGIGLFGFLPTLEIDGAGERRHHDELRKGHAGFLRESGGGGERVGLIGGEAKDEGPEHVHAVVTERLELFDEIVAGEIEILIDSFQTFGSDRFDAD